MKRVSSPAPTKVNEVNSRSATWSTGKATITASNSSLTARSTRRTGLITRSASVASSGGTREKSVGGSDMNHHSTQVSRPEATASDLEGGEIAYSTAAIRSM